jgi:release factor glutamine methyltransferase
MQPTIQYIIEELHPFYPNREIESFIQLIFSHVKNYTLTDLVLKRAEKLSVQEINDIRQIVGRLKLHEPIHYITGTTEFAGIKLRVNPSVLIPRPETEELVEWIKESEISLDSILDIGTGSGCIALSLKKQIPGACLTGCDVSPEALITAKENAEINAMDVHFMEADILRWKDIPWPGQYGLIVSNPPYVTVSERAAMNKNVLDYEPHKALFVEDDNPLKFYKAIVNFASEWLMPEGKLYFEINEKFGSQMRDLMHCEGFRSIEIKRDLQEKVRMIRGTWPG